MSRVHINMSRSYFSQCFTRFAGQSFGEMLRGLRIERAKALLLATDAPVYEIAFSAGFEDDKYFSRVFKERVGPLAERVSQRRGENGRTPVRNRFANCVRPRGICGAFSLREASRSGRMKA